MQPVVIPIPELASWWSKRGGDELHGLQVLPVLRLWNPKLEIEDNSVHELG